VTINTAPLWPIGFNFCYNGSTYSQCVISSNGYISFNTALAGSFSPWVTVSVPALTPAEVRNSILGPWQDLYPPAAVAPAGDPLSDLGVSPNRRFVVSYSNVPMFSCTNLTNTIQIVLYEGTNCIGTYLQNKASCASWNSGHGVHAVHNGGGTQAVVIAGRNNTAWTATNEGRYFSPTCAPCSTAVSASCVVPTPVELLHFSGRHDGNTNVLEWATASEQNTDHFTVERSEDGYEFLSIGTVPAAGNSHQVLSYMERDESPMHGVNYYRLRSTDLDGSEELSEVIAISNLGPNGILIYPNPSQGPPGYLLPDEAPYPAVIVLRDLAGREVKRVIADAPEGVLDINGLAAGTYYVEMEASGPAAAVRLVIQ
jgi:hypothetical protein